MPAEYVKSPRIEEVARDLIRIHHQNLTHAIIAYVMKKAPEGSGGPKPPKRMGKHSKMACMRKPNAIYELLTGLDFILEVDETWWDVLDLEQQQALIDHELCHGAVDEDGYYLKDHDLEEFCAVVQRNGQWNNGIKSFANSLQLNFSFEETAKTDQPVAVQ